MTARKTASKRESDLKLAMYRIERGRAHTGATKLSIAAVAREAGVSTALIHNHYPSIAESIRIKLGAASRQQRDAKQAELQAERTKNKALRDELKASEGRVAQLASINEVLLSENAVLKAQIADPKVTPFRR